jgi:hypothetical protein
VTLIAACGALAAAGVASAATPTVETLAPDTTLITDSYALLSGSLNPNGVNVDYRFDWGRTASYGRSTPLTSAGNGKADVPVDISLDALKPSTTYHYRLVVVTDAGTEIDGTDQSLTTTPALGLAVASTKVRATSKGVVPVKVIAVGPPDETASGTLTLRLFGHPKVLGAVSYSLAVGTRKTLTLRLSKPGQAALSAARKGARVVLAARTQGARAIASKTLKLGV